MDSSTQTPDVNGHDCDATDNLKVGSEPKIEEKDGTVKKKTKLYSRPSFKKDKIDAHYDKLPWVVAAFGRLFGLRFAPISIPLERRFQTFAAFFWMTTFLFMGLGSLLFLIYLFFYTQYWWISLSYFTYFIADKSVCERGGRRSQFFREGRIWKHFAHFFPAQIIKTCDYDASRNYIFGYHPHGILSAGAVAHFATEATGFSKLFPGLCPHLLTLVGQFYLPFLREFIMCHGAVAASKESMNYMLGNEDHKGKVLALVVGGARESLDSHSDKVVLHLSMRKGFCKIALKNGACLVPTFSFGETSVYEQYPNPKGSALRKVQDYLQKKIGLAPCVFMGRGIFQYSFGFVPFRKPINTVFGPSVNVTKVRDPTDEQISELHSRYVKALTDLYYAYKDQFAEDPTLPLVIL